MEAGEPNSAAWNVYKLESFLDAFLTWVKVDWKWKMDEDGSLLVISRLVTLIPERGRGRLEKYVK